MQVSSRGGVGMNAAAARRSLDVHLTTACGKLLETAETLATACIADPGGHWYKGPTEARETVYLRARFDHVGTGDADIRFSRWQVETIGYRTCQSLDQGVIQ